MFQTVIPLQVKQWRFAFWITQDPSQMDLIGEHLAYLGDCLFIEDVFGVIASKRLCKTPKDFKMAADNAKEVNRWRDYKGDNQNETFFGLNVEQCRHIVEQCSYVKRLQQFFVVEVLSNGNALKLHYLKTGRTAYLFPWRFGVGLSVSGEDDEFFAFAVETTALDEKLNILYHTT